VILQKGLGRSGTLRAPTLRVGEIWIIGFQEPLYADLLLNDS